MKQMKLTVVALVFLYGVFPAPAKANTPIVQISTDFGNITLKLFPDEAPITVENFLGYVRDGFYDGTLFHRVIEGFMIQGGGLAEGFQVKTTRDPILNEANSGLSNQRGTIAMARTSSPHSATSQFFINQVDNPFLDFSAETQSGWGYAVFGQVIEDGMDVVDQIAAVPTVTLANGLQDVPENDVVMQEVRLIVASSDATYDLATDILQLPVVQVGDQIFEATMKNLGGGLFELTHLQALTANFEFPEATYDFATSILDLERVQAGNEFYTAKLTYIGNNQLTLTHLELASAADGAEP